jgi:hypothetical protein
MIRLELESVAADIGGRRFVGFFRGQAASPGARADQILTVLPVAVI